MTLPIKMVILDRDGTINQDSDQFIKSADEWVPIPGALAAIARLNHAGYQVVVVSNQSGVGRGLFGVDALNAMHQKMKQLLAAEGGRIEAIFFCPHAPTDDCDCRKPKPGMFYEVAKRFKVSLSDVPAVGDSLRDLDAAIAAGAQPYLVRTGKGKETEKQGRLPEGTKVFDDLSSFVDDLLR